MASKKKTWRKTIEQESLLQSFEQLNKEKELKNKQASLKDSDLFKVNVNKDGLKAKRDKLRKDRFKEQDKPKSKYEEELVKKFIQKEENKKKNPPLPPKKTDEEEEAEYRDLWGGDNTIKSRNIAKFKKFNEKSIVKVKPVVLPLPGQSYNPSAKDHKEVINKVVSEEMRDVEEAQKRLKHLKPYLFKDPDAELEQEKKKSKTIDDSDEGEEESDSDNEEGVEIKNRPVDRKKKLTKTERNKKLVKRMNREQQEKVKEEKDYSKQFNKLPIFIKEYEEKEQKIKENMKRRREEEYNERKTQEEVGIINKPVQVGKYKYKMRKTDFVTEDELAGSLRTIKAKATPADIIVERFDSVYRRNLMEPEAPVLGADKKRVKKAKFKWHEKGGKTARKLAKINEDKKTKRGQKEKGNGVFKDDLILL